MLGPRLPPKAGTKSGIHQKALQRRGQSRSILYGYQKARPLVLHNLWHGSDRGANNRQSMSESFYHAHRQVLDQGGQDKNISRLQFSRYTVVVEPSRYLHAFGEPKSFDQNLCLCYCSVTSKRRVPVIAMLNYLERIKEISNSFGRSKTAEKQDSDRTIGVTVLSLRSGRIGHNDDAVRQLRQF